MFHLHRWVGVEWLASTCLWRWNRRSVSKTSGYKIQTPLTYTDESIQHSEHGGSLKSRIISLYCKIIIQRKDTFPKISGIQDLCKSSSGSEFRLNMQKKKKKNLRNLLLGRGGGKKYGKIICLIQLAWSEWVTPAFATVTLVRCWRKKYASESRAHTICDFVTSGLAWLALWPWNWTFK